MSRECEKLVRLALNRGAPDNITGIMFYIDVLGKRRRPVRFHGGRSLEKGNLVEYEGKIQPPADR